MRTRTFIIVILVALFGSYLYVKLVWGSFGICNNYDFCWINGTIETQIKFAMDKRARLVKAR